VFELSQRACITGYLQNTVIVIRKNILPTLLILITFDTFVETVFRKSPNRYMKYLLAATLVGIFRKI
jgi:hypothetical protein